MQGKPAKATTVELVSHRADTMEVGSAGEEEEAEVDFEEIPEYLLILPKTNLRKVLVSCSVFVCVCVCVCVCGCLSS